MSSSHASSGSFVSREGIRLSTRRWVPLSEPRAVVALIHGFAEHSGRYDKHVTRFTDAGIAVETYDHAGHGRSDGRRGYIDDYESLVCDACDFLSRLIAEYPDTPAFLIGQSMGASLAVLATVRHHERLAGLIMCSPAIALMEPPWIQKLALLLSRMVPRLAFKPLNRNHLSTDTRIAGAYEADPLTFCNRIAIRTAAEIIRLGKATMSSASQISIPLLVIHGADDQITSPGASAAFYESAASADKSVSFYRDMYHETFNEPGGNRVLDGIVDFVVDHCNGEVNTETTF